MKIKAVIFDMDGLMFDTEKLVEDSWIAYGKRNHYPIDSIFMGCIRGRNSAAIEKIVYEKLGRDFPYQDARKSCYEDIFSVIDTKGIPVKDGLLTLLEKLKENKFAIALATSTARERAMAYLENAKITHYFDSIICGDMVTYSKPDPEIFLKAAKQVSFTAEECLVLEDSPNGVKAAFAAHCPVVMVPDLDAPTEEIKQLANKIVPSLNEVYEIIEKWNREGISSWQPEI